MIRVKHLVGGGGDSRHWNNLADWVCQKRQAGHKRLQLTTGAHVMHTYRIHLTPSSSITSIVVSRRASARSYERRLFRNGKGIRQLFCWLVSGREEEFRLAHAPVLNPLSPVRCWTSRHHLHERKEASYSPHHPPTNQTANQAVIVIHKRHFNINLYAHCTAFQSKILLLHRKRTAHSLFCVLSKHC